MEYIFSEREARAEDAVERLGTRSPACQSCLETRPLALMGSYPDIICYACDARVRGMRPTEEHHPAGRHNLDWTVPVPINDHRDLSDRQVDWPGPTLQNPNGSPVLRAAAAIRGWLNILAQLIEHTIGWIPPFLECLDAILTESLGPAWWTDWGLTGGTA